MTDIPTWHERAMRHPDHQSGMVSEAMIRARMCEEIEDLRAKVERLREVLLHISRYETVGPAGFEWDIVVEELVTIARDALEAKS